MKRSLSVTIYAILVGVVVAIVTFVALAAAGDSAGWGMIILAPLWLPLFTIGAVIVGSIAGRTAYTRHSRAVKRSATTSNPPAIEE
jgi:ABC-type antimicrobial peptide transport system permease subunit